MQLKMMFVLEIKNFCETNKQTPKQIASLRAQVLPPPEMPYVS